MFLSSRCHVALALWPRTPTSRASKFLHAPKPIVLAGPLCNTTLTSATSTDDRDRF